MLRFSSERAWHPSLWPFYVLRSLTLWAAITGGALGAIYFTFGGPLAVISIAAMFAAFWVLILGLIPAVLIALLDLAFVGRRNRRSNRYPVPRHRRRGAQSAITWALGGAVVGAAVTAGYAVVYLNAFSPRASLTDLLGLGLTAGSSIGLAAGWLTAVELNAADSLFPSDSMMRTIKRGTFSWMVTMIGFGIGVYVLREPSLERTLLPATLLGFIGAGVVPLLAATSPLGGTPSASSPGPTEPEGGPGEEAEGDWRIARPPQFPHTQFLHTPSRPDRDLADLTSTEVDNG